ncbi:MAG: aminoacetone oxidase family FAD-binding enzyme [Oscillospiraceae bacterium]|nr:aminoacetone oxidase family FAD-binding enzyme [Oscillospiraceae bacterium]
MKPAFSTVAVVGGGASGMIAALTAAEVPGRRVLLLERQQRVGRKLLATGNGRCNLSNQNAVPEDYFGTDPAFAVPALAAFSPVDTQSFFAKLGLLTVTEPGGRIYPFSDSANSVLDVLRFALDRAGVEQRCSFPVEEITADQTGYRLRSGEESLHADAVILACGGAAGAKLGGVMDGYRLGKALGHKRSALYPSLTRILTDPEYPRALKGIRVQAKLRLTRHGVLLAESSGEIQFTETGVSGPAGFDLSRAVSFGGDGQMLHLQLLPYEEEGIRSLISARLTQFPELEAAELFTGMLHNRLGRILVKAAGIPAAAKLSSLMEAHLQEAARQCADFRLPVRGVDGFDAAQVTAGGLLTEGFDPETLESRLHPGLFACGEVLDIDGPCGGYNLQWAWASGRLAGRLGA